MDYSKQSKRIWMPEAPNLIINRTRELELPSHDIGIAGYYRAELIRRGKVILDTGWNKNLITNAGLNLLMTQTVAYNTMFGHMAVGTSSVAPAFTQTTLGAEISTRSNANGGIADVGPLLGPANAYWYSRRTRLFTEAQANGNLTEWGWFSAATGGTMIVRQLFKDALGDAITITKTNEDQLRITYEMRCINPIGVSDVVDTITIPGVGSVEVTTRPGQYLLAGFANNLYATLVQLANPNTNHLSPQGHCAEAAAFFGHSDATTPNSASSATLGTYTTDTFWRDTTARWDPAIANFTTGIGFVRVGSNRVIQSILNPKVPKTSTQRFFATGRTAITRV